MSTEPTRADVCVLACAEAFRGDGEILASPMGLIPSLGAKLARATFEPDLLMTDGVASLVRDGVFEGPMPYRRVFEMLWSGRRHVMMGAAQLDRYGNQNISCIGDHARPKAQLLGVRGAPGNTLNHRTSYWIGRHGPRALVERVDMVSGVGNDRAAALGAPARRFHGLGAVVTNLAVLDFGGPDGQMRLVSTHPGVGVDEVDAATGFEFARAPGITTTRAPTGAELLLIDRALDPEGRRHREVPG